MSERLAREVADGWDVRVALIDGQPVGFCAVARGTSVLEQLWLDPQRQRHGIGTALLEEAKQRYPAGLFLHVQEDNERALALYRRHGFVVDGSHRHAWLPATMIEMAWQPTTVI